MRMRLTALLLIIAVLAVPRAQGADSDGKYYVYGPGASSCGTWMQEKAWQDQQFYFAKQMWVLGFLSGVGATLKAKALDTDLAAVTVFMDTYCQAHPLNHIVDGAEGLVKELAAGAK